jgi:proteasome accessory factor C
MTDNAASRASRLLDLVPFILSHPGISIRQLAVDFSTTKEEMIKDLNLLFMCGLPGYTPLELIDISFDDESVVVRDPQNLSTPRKLTESESLIARIALAAIEELTPPSSTSRSQIAGVRTKLAAAFNSEIPDGSLLVTMDEERVSLSKVKEAIEQLSDVEITYNNLSTDEISRRQVSPFSIRIENDRTFIEGFCHKAQAQRTFNLAQISQVKIVERSRQNLEDSGSRNQGFLAVLEIQSEESDFLRLNHSQLRSVGKNLYEIEVFRPEWLVRSILSTSHPLTLNAPAHLRESLVEFAKTALNNYTYLAKN